MKFSTGGERKFFRKSANRRFACRACEIQAPTVIVRMKEDAERLGRIFCTIIPDVQFVRRAFCFPRTTLINLWRSFYGRHKTIFNRQKNCRNGNAHGACLRGGLFPQNSEHRRISDLRAQGRCAHNRRVHLRPRGRACNGAFGVLARNGNRKLNGRYRTFDELFGFGNVRRRSLGNLLPQKNNAQGGYRTGCRLAVDDSGNAAVELHYDADLYGRSAPGSARNVPARAHSVQRD